MLCNLRQRAHATMGALCSNPVPASAVDDSTTVAPGSAKVAPPLSREERRARELIVAAAGGDLEVVQRLVGRLPSSPVPDATPETEDVSPDEDAGAAEKAGSAAAGTADGDDKGAAAPANVAVTLPDGGRAAAASADGGSISSNDGDLVPLDVTVTDNNTALHVSATAGHGAVVAFLIAKGAPVECRNGKGQTPMLCAARSGHAEIVRQLVDAGANVVVVETTEPAWGSLSAACSIGSAECAEIIVEALLAKLAAAATAAGAAEAPTAGDVGTTVGANARALEQALTHVDSNGDTPLHLACRGDYTGVVGVLLRTLGEAGEGALERALALQNAATHTPYDVTDNHDVHRLLHPKTMRAGNIR